MNNPNPGSQEAIDLGCSCPVMDNHYGQGFPWGSSGKNQFWISEDCKIHGNQYNVTPPAQKENG